MTINKPKNKKPDSVLGNTFLSQCYLFGWEEQSSPN